MAIAAVLGWPRIGLSVFSRIERPLARLARRKRMSVALVGLAALFRVEAAGQPFGRRIERNLPKTGTYNSEPAVNLGEIP